MWKVLKNQAFIRWTANKPSTSLIIATVQCFCSSASSTRQLFFFFFYPFWLLLESSSFLRAEPWKQHLDEERLKALQPLWKITRSTQSCRKENDGDGKRNSPTRHQRWRCLDCMGGMCRVPMTLFFPYCPGFSFYPWPLIDNLSIQYSLIRKWIGRKV